MEQFALAVISLMHTCMGSRRSRGLSVAAIWNHVGESVVRPLFSVYYYSTFLIFLLPSLTTPLFVPTVITVWRVPGYPCVWGGSWLGCRDCNGSVLLTRGWLITVEALGHLDTHLPLSSIQLLKEFIVLIISLHTEPWCLPFIAKSWTKNTTMFPSAGEINS